MLKVAVAHSDDPDTVAAVDEMIRQCESQLVDLPKPQAALLFAAISHDGQEILNGIQRAYPGIQLIGCTTDGEVSSVLKFSEDSITLILFSSDELTMRAGLGRDLGDDPAAASAAAVAMAAGQLDEKPEVCITTPDSLTASAVNVLDGLKAALGRTFPIVGGVAGDCWNFDRTYQFFNDQVVTDSVPVLLISGPVVLSSGAASGWEPMGDRKIVTRAQGNVVHEIDGESAVQFYRRYLGEHASLSPEHPLAVFTNGTKELYLRAPMDHDAKTGSITFVGDVPTGAQCQLTAATRDGILQATQDSIKLAFQNYPGASPAAVLCFSCAARKQLLGTQTGREYELLRTDLDEQVPVCGFYTYGEIAPLQPGEESYFHNQTFITVLIGTR